MEYKPAPLKWKDIKFSFQPTTLLAADSFKIPVEKIVKAWMMIPEARASAEHPDLAKASINSAIGSLICRDQTFSYTCRTSGRLNEDIPHWNKHLLPMKIGESDYWDYITKKSFSHSIHVAPFTSKSCN